ncbi:hypothetical protein ACVWZZ_002166 [Bradyrhizobium sp. LM6.10]
MAGPLTQKDVERRAYQLWEQAGMPKGRDQEFYLEAERQLKEELIHHETQNAGYAVENKEERSARLLWRRDQSTGCCNDPAVAQRTMESIRPMPGTVSARVAIRTPSGPPRTAIPPLTSRTVQPSMVVGLVSGVGMRGAPGVRCRTACVMSLAVIVVNTQGRRQHGVHRSACGAESPCSAADRIQDRPSPRRQSSQSLRLETPHAMAAASPSDAKPPAVGFKLANDRSMRSIAASAISPA